MRTKRQFERRLNLPIMSNITEATIIECRPKTIQNRLSSIEQTIKKPSYKEAAQKSDHCLSSEFYLASIVSSNLYRDQGFAYDVIAAMFVNQTKTWQPYW